MLFKSNKNKNIYKKKNVFDIYDALIRGLTIYVIGVRVRGEAGCA